MSNNIKKMNEICNWLENFKNLNFSNKSSLIIGGGEISKQHILALTKLGVSDITVISDKGKNISAFCNDKKIKLLTGGFEKNLANIEKKDLTIIATPIPKILSATEMAIQHDQTNILIEKPGSLFSKELEYASKSLSKFQIRVGFNRLVYPNFHKLKNLCEKEGGITSCRFTFTERISKIDFKKKMPDVYKRWGISNSLHPISMAFELIGLPKKIYSQQYGNLKWHPTGSLFVGYGLSKQEIPFSYHADWGSGGRWGIEVNTSENSYQLIPLEDLFVCKKDTGVWNQVKFKKSFADIKQGITEEIAIMLDDDKKYINLLPSLKKTSEYLKTAETIFGYN